MNVLVVKANNRPSSQAVSSKMFEAFMENIEVENVTVFDLFEEYTPYFGQDFFAIFGKLQNGETLTDEEQAMLAAQQKVQKLFTEADIIVYAFPLWNLTIPAKLQTFIDYVFQAGFTFKYNEQGQMVSLQPNKKVVLLTPLFLIKNVELFQKDPSYMVMLATWQKMGTGITLTASSYAIFIDCAWTSA